MRIALVVLGLLSAASAAVAQQEVQVSGSAGWGGRVIRGEHAPVNIDLDNRGKKDIELVIAVTWAATFATQSRENPSLGDVFGRSGPVHHVAVTLPAKTRKRISLTLLTPDSSQMSVWAFAEDSKGRTVARGELLARVFDANKRIVGVVGTARPEGLEDGSVDIANIGADELPEDWQGYSALEALVWLDGRATEIRSTAQVDALKQWISGGGRFCVARGNTIGLAGTPIAELLPAKLGATREVASLGGGPLPDGPAVILDCTPRKGAILRAETGGSPLVVQANRDGGRVIFAAFDPSRPPFSGWSESKAFWKWLLDINRAPPPPKTNEEQAPRAIGSRLLAHQAGRFPDVAAPEIGGLFLLIILYLVVVGPLDYVLLRWLKKLEYTWFTFPAYVVLFTLFILLVGGAFIQRAAHQREITVVDHFPETNFVRSRALSAVLAPADVLYKVDDAQPLSSNFINTDRMYDSGAKTTDIRIMHGQQRTTENWLLNRNFTGLALADRCGSAPSPLSYLLSAQQKGEIKLSVKNATSETFENATLVTPDGVFGVKAIPPGESVVVGNRIFATLAEFVEKEGQQTLAATDLYGNPYGYNRYENGATGLTERDLNPLVRKALIGITFPPLSPDNQTELISGMSRGLQARRWLETGGSMLLVWPGKNEAVVQFDPKPGRYTSVTLYRFFQGPPP
jgi:hypothetical protein